MTPVSRPMPLDQADGLRRMFGRASVQFVPVVSNPHVAFGGVMLERLCAAVGALGKHTLVVDAAERSPAPLEMAEVDLIECVEPLSDQVSYLAARGLPLRFVDTHGSTAGFLQAAADAAPYADVVLVHASAPDLCRLFARAHVRPLVLADDRPASVTHAYAGMKLLTHRAALVVFDLLLAAAPQSPRAGRIATQLASCADNFLGAVLHEWMQVDPASEVDDALTPELQRWAAGVLRPLAPAAEPAYPAFYGADGLAASAYGHAHTPQETMAYEALN